MNRNEPVIVNRRRLFTGIGLGAAAVVTAVLPRRATADQGLGTGLDLFEFLLTREDLETELPPLINRLKKEIRRLNEAERRVMKKPNSRSKRRRLRKIRARHRRCVAQLGILQEVLAAPVEEA